MAGSAAASPVPIRMATGVARQTSTAIFISRGSIFLPRYSGRAPDHQPGDEDGENGKADHAVETAADAAEDDLAELHLEHLDHAAEAGCSCRASS